LKKIVYLSLVLLLISCANKREFLGGLENLKWNSDVTDIKNYMENTLRADYNGYKINRAEKSMSLFFSGSKFAGIDVNEWELKSRNGKFFEYTIKFPNTEKIFERINKTLVNKLGEPDRIEDKKYFWKRLDIENNLSEKISLRKFEDAVVLKVEAEKK